MEVSVKRGYPASVTAPLTDTGFIKLAEIIVPAAAMGINAENIKNITAITADAENLNWTMDIAHTFNPGYIADIIASPIANYVENIVIKAANIMFGISADEVRGLIIPTGRTINVKGESFNALAGITQVLTSLAGAVNAAYPYANDLLSRYQLLNANPVAASTENVDVGIGGEIIIDGIACTEGQMVFLKDQTNPVQNGLWEVQTGAWNRHAGFTAAKPNVFTNKLVLVKNGDVNHGKVFYLEEDKYTVGTSQLVFKASFLSPAALPGTVVFRDNEGKYDAPDPNAILEKFQKLLDEFNSENAAELKNLLEQLQNLSNIPGGLPSGGAVGQILEKAGENDYDARWVDKPDDGGNGSGSNVEGIPVGGTTGQILEKASNGNYDVRWADKLNIIASTTDPGSGSDLPNGTIYVVYE
jgi:hypothetical protein